MNDTGYDVVIPAGGTIDTSYAEAIGTPFRALAPLGRERKPVLQLIIDALRESGCVRRVIIVAPEAVRDAVTGFDLWLPVGENGAQNILDGLAKADPDRPAVICPSDLPLLTADSIRGFLQLCQPETQLSVGMVSADHYHTVFRAAPPSTFVTLKDHGPVTLGGLFLVSPRVITRQATLLAALFGARKSEWQIARLLGWRLLWGWATKSLTLQIVAARAEKLLAADVQVVPDLSPLLAYDIDTLDDYTYANQHFGKSAAQPSPAFSD